MDRRNNGTVSEGVALGSEETRLISEREKAIVASRHKSEFVANLSHELRTPLNGILGMAELLAQSPLTRDQHQYLDVLHRAGETLLRLVNNVLDLSRVEAGKLVLEKTPFDLQQWLMGAFEIVIRRANEKGITLLMDLENGLPPTLVGDPLRLHQILLNLLDNAVKFTVSGSVRVSVKKETRANGESRLLVCVADTGIGIPREKVGTIFEAFTQVDSSTTRQYGGTGLGLSIVKSLVELMEGDLQVESQQGSGTTVTVNLPLIVSEKSERVRAPFADAQIPQASLPRRPLRILLGEDSEDNRLLIVAFLKGLPYEIEVAENGKAAVEKWHSGNFDLILMDVQMPIMDGYSATRAIRRWETANFLPRTRIFALTAHAFEEDKQKSFAAGCDAHLTKPISRDGLLRAIEGSYDAPSVGALTPPLASAAVSVADTGEILVQVPPMLLPLVPGLLERRRRDLSLIESALSAGDFGTIAALCHKMRGDAGSYGFHGLAEIALEIERHAKALEREEVRTAMARLADYLSRCVPYGTGGTKPEDMRQCANLT